MNANLHPVMAEILRGIIPPQRTDGPWEYDADARQVIAPKCGYLADDMALAELPDLGGEERGNGYLMAAAPDLHRQLAHLYGLLAPMEAAGTLRVPGLATLNGARLALAKADGAQH